MRWLAALESAVIDCRDRNARGALQKYFRADMEMGGEFFDVPSGEVAFSIEYAVAQTDVSAEETGEVAGRESVFREKKLEGFESGKTGNSDRVGFVGLDQFGERFEVIVLIGGADGQDGEGVDDFLGGCQFGVVVDFAGHEAAAEFPVGFGQGGRASGFDFCAHSSLFHWLVSYCLLVKTRRT